MRAETFEKAGLRTSLRLLWMTDNATGCKPRQVSIKQCLIFQDPSSWYCNFLQGSQTTRVDRLPSLVMSNQITSHSIKNIIFFMCFIELHSCLYRVYFSFLPCFPLVSVRCGFRRSRVCAEPSRARRCAAFFNSAHTQHLTVTLCANVLLTKMRSDAAADLAEAETSRVLRT